MMLNTDMCLGWNDNKKHQACMRKIGFKKFRKCNKLQKAGRGHYLNAATSERCCSWFRSKTMGVGHKRSKKDGQILNKGELFCGKPWTGTKSFIQEKELCCGEKFDAVNDCDASAWPKGWGFEKIQRFARNEPLWLKSLVHAWRMAVTKNSHYAKFRFSRKNKSPTFQLGKIDWSSKTLNHKK